MKGNQCASIEIGRQLAIPEISGD